MSKLLSAIEKAETIAIGGCARMAIASVPAWDCSGT